MTTHKWKHNSEWPYDSCCSLCGETVSDFEKQLSAITSEDLDENDSLVGPCMPELIRVLSFYADPWSSPETDFGQFVPDHYGDMDFGERARELLRKLEGGSNAR